MENLNLETLELTSLKFNELQNSNGGFISYISVGGIFKFVLGEATDFIDGFKAGYNLMTN